MKKWGASASGFSGSALREPGVIYVGGYGRSGSTLLDILLGTHPEIESSGELVHFLPEMEKRSSQCSCGATTRDCGRWKHCFSRVIEVMEGAGLSPEKARRVQKRLESRLSLTRSFLGLPSRGVDVRLYAIVQETLLDAIAQDSSGARFVVDSSKTASSMGGRPFALELAVGGRVYFIHLVRRPESVVGSLLKGSNKNLERAANHAGRHGVLKGLLGWIQANAAGLMAGRVLGKERYMQIRYEDLVNDPQMVFRRLSVFLHVDYEPWTEVIARKPLEVDWHLFSGNRMRHGRVKLEGDVFEQDIPPFYRFVSQILCWPLKRRLRY